MTKKEKQKSVASWSSGNNNKWKTAMEKKLEREIKHGDQLERQVKNLEDQLEYQKRVQENIQLKKYKKELQDRFARLKNHRDQGHQKASEDRRMRSRKEEEEDYSSEEEKMPSKGDRT